MKTKAKIQSYTFKVVIEEDAFADGTRAYHVYIPALKGCRSWGYTVEEALENIRWAAEAWIEDMLKHGEAIPQEAEACEEPLITVHVTAS